MQARSLGTWLVGSMSVCAVLLGAGSASAQPEEVEGTCSNYQLSPSAATLSSAGGSGTLDITWDWEEPPLDGFCIANCTSASCGEQTGSARSSAPWLTGTKDGDDQVDYTVAGGYGGSSSRTATLTVAGATFTVTQQPPGPCPSSPDGVSPTSTSFPAATSVRYVRVTGRSDCSWSVSADQGWLTTPSSVSGGGSVRIQAGENPGGAREGTVAIGGSSVSVSQASGCPTAPTTVSPSSLTFSAAGGTQRLSVTGPAGCSWPVSDDQAWITATPTSVLSGGSVTVTVLSGHAGESGTVTIGSRDIPVSVPRLACRRTPDSVTPSSLTFPWPGGTENLTVAGPAHCRWSVSDDRAWITATPSTVAAGNMVEVRVTPGPPGRSGTVAIGGTDVPVTVEPCPPSPTSVTPASLRFPPAGGTESLSGTGPAGCSWPVRDNQAWIATTPSRVSADGRVSVTVGSGSAGGSGTVTIGGRDIPIIVDPCPASPTGVMPMSLTFTAAAGRREVTVAGPAGCSWPVRASDIWINVVPPASPGSFAIGVDRNDDPRRTGTVTFGADGIVTVAQEPVTLPPCPTVPSRSVMLGGSVGDTATVTLLEAERCRYEVSESLTWLGAAPSPVAGDAMVTFTAREANDTGAGRPGTVMIGGAGGRAVTVTQDPVAPPPCPTVPGVSSRSVTLGGSVGDTATVTLLEAERCRYEVSESLTWLGAAPSPVAGDAMVTFTAREENDTGAGRPGTVMIGGAGGRAVTVTQDPVAPPPCPTSPSVSSTSVRLGSADDATGTVRLRQDPDCRYDVSESLDWLSVDGSSTVSGDATVTFRTEGENDTGAERSGTVMIGDTNFVVTQAPLAPILCPTAPSLSTTSVSFGHDRGLATITLHEDSVCDYNVRTDPDWISANRLTAPGNATLTVTVAYNAGTARTGTVSIGDRDVHVSQEAEPLPPGSGRCLYGVFPDLLQVPNAGGHGTIDVSWRYQADDELLDPAILDHPGCVAWAPSTFPTWLSVNKLDAHTATYTVAPNTTSSGREGFVRVGDRRTAVYQGVHSLTRHRHRLLQYWATERQKGDVCDAWDSLGATAREVFLWNTHRLFVTDMLPEVTKLYSIKGADGGECGGAGYNRTFMSMSPRLHTRLVRTDRGESTVPDWRRSHDFACFVDLPIINEGECPHPPFHHQIETKADSPTGQVQLFQAGLVNVLRHHYQGFDTEFRLVRNCGVAPRRELVALDSVCHEPPCFQGYPVGLCTGGTNYRDSDNRSAYAYDLKYDDDYRVDDVYSFEMDQDYSLFVGSNFHVHSSAPHCDGTDMRPIYSDSHGDPGWDWRPPGCSTRVATARFTDEVDTASGGPTGIRAVYIQEARARVGGLRRRLALAPFVWTDPAVTYGVTPIKAVHIGELRGALAEAYTVGGRNAPVYTDELLVPGVTGVRAVHLTELREAILALEKAMQ